MIAGPDHISALAALTANTSGLESFSCGIRWGLGHSIGLLIIGTSLIIIDSKRRNGNGDVDDDDEARIDINQTFEIFCQALVGVFMISLGLYSMKSSFMKHKQSVPADEINADLEMSNATTDSEIDTPTFPVHNGEASMTIADTLHNKMKPPKKTSSKTDTSHNHNFHHDHSSCCSCLNEVVPKPILSFLVGIIHGVAGPGGVLGVIPAVQLHNFTLAMLYLITFSLVSTFLMGVVAAFYGSFTSYISEKVNISNMEYRVEMFSAGLSIIVGTIWLFLLSIGKLSYIHPYHHL